MLFLLIQAPLWLHWIGGSFLVVHLILVLRRYVFYRHPKSVIRLWCDDQSNWRVQYQDACVKAVTLFQSVILSRFFIFIAFRMPGRIFPLPVPLALDSEHPEHLRSLRRLLLQSNQSVKK